jgi:hypothetical protein
MKDEKWRLNRKIGNYTTMLADKAGGSAGSSNTVRVKDIILDSSHPLFNQYGQWNGIGTIFFESTQNPIFSPSTKLIAAYPLLSNIKQYPLINELVTLLYLSDTNILENTTSVSPYYLPPLNLWNSQIHNALPSTDILPPEQQKDYQTVTAGSFRRVTDQSTEIKLGNTFNESNVLDIFPLLPYEGDIIYEGRYGNSIRLGATVNNAPNGNNWSSIGNNGNPIMILKNGQSFTQTNVEGTNESWVPCLEDINNDQSSIYLTSTQKIPLTLRNELYGSYEGLTESPTPANQFSGNQIILNSGRLVFNAKNDHIILSADKSVHLSAGSSINFDTGNQIGLKADKTIILSPKIYLGLAQGTEGYVGSEIQSVVLGENLIQVLTNISNALTGIGQAMSTAAAGPFPVPSLLAEGPRLIGEAESLKKLIGEITSSPLLSKTVKTKK